MTISMLESFKEDKLSFKLEIVVRSKISKVDGKDI